MPAAELHTPSLALLPSYAEALRRGWSPDNVRDVAPEHLAAIAADPGAFVARQANQDASGTVTLADGRTVARLPGLIRWIVADAGGGAAFAGQIGFRHQPGTEELPPHCGGHIGYAVVPWMRRRGLALLALARVLPEARAVGLRWVEVTCDPGNVASRRVIEGNGGALVGTKRYPWAPDSDKLVFRIAL